MTTYFIYMGQMRSLSQLRRLFLLDEKPEQDLVVYDGVTLQEEGSRLKDHAEKISHRIDMESALREDFSVVVYVPVQECATGEQFAREAPSIAAREALYILEIEWELLSAFWKRGKYPKRIHILFGEYGEYGSFLEDVFQGAMDAPQTDVPLLRDALWKELTHSENKQSAEETFQAFERALEEEGTNNRWSALNSMGLKEEVRRHVRSIQQGTAIAARQLLCNTVFNLYHEIGRRNPLRDTDVGESGTDILVRRIRLEKNYDLHEKMRNETAVFLYVYSGEWQSAEAPYFNSQDAHPQKLIRNAEQIARVNLLKSHMPGMLDQRTQQLKEALAQIDPDTAGRIAPLKAEQTIRTNARRWKDILAEAGADPLPTQKSRKERTRDLLLPFRASKTIFDMACRRCDRVLEESSSIQEKVHRYALQMNGAFNEVKYRQLSEIEAPILSMEASYENGEASVDTALLEIVEGDTEKNIADLEGAILDPANLGFVWPGDITSEAERAKGIIRKEYERLRWTHIIYMMIVPVLFALLFALPYIALRHLLPDPAVLLLTLGTAMCAYAVSGFLFVRRHKRRIEETVEELEKNWRQRRAALDKRARSYESMLHEYIPRLFAQYQFRKHLQKAGKKSRVRRSKITYHKRRLEEQLQTIRSLMEDLDMQSLSGLSSNRKSKNEEAAVPVDYMSSAVSDVNRSLYGFSAQDALEMLKAEGGMKV